MAERLCLAGHSGRLVGHCVLSSESAWPKQGAASLTDKAGQIGSLESPLTGGAGGAAARTWMGGPLLCPRQSMALLRAAGRLISLQTAAGRLRMDSPRAACQFHLKARPLQNELGKLDISRRCPRCCGAAAAAAAASLAIPPAAAASRSARPHSFQPLLPALPREGRQAGRPRILAHPASPVPLQAPVPPERDPRAIIAAFRVRPGRQQRKRRRAQHGVTECASSVPLSSCAWPGQGCHQLCQRGSLRVLNLPGMGACPPPVRRRLST